MSTENSNALVNSQASTGKVLPVALSELVEFDPANAELVDFLSPEEVWAARNDNAAPAVASGAVPQRFQSEYARKAQAERARKVELYGEAVDFMKYRYARGVVDWQKILDESDHPRAGEMRTALDEMVSAAMVPNGYEDARNVTVTLRQWLNVLNTRHAPAPVNNKSAKARKLLTHGIATGKLIDDTPVRTRENKKKNLTDDNIESMQLACLDFDGSGEGALAPSADAIRAWLISSGIAGVIVSSYSHVFAKPRFKVFVFLREALSLRTAEDREVWSIVYPRLAQGHDLSCNNAARYQHIGHCEADATGDAYVEFVPGGMWDLTAELDAARAEVRARAAARPLRSSTQKTLGAAEAGARASAVMAYNASLVVTNDKGKQVGLLRAAALGLTACRMADAVRAVVDAADIRSGAGDLDEKLDMKCPMSNRHTDSHIIENQRGFYVANPGVMDDVTGCSAGCRHNSCTPDDDRLVWLARLLEAYPALWDQVRDRALYDWQGSEAEWEALVECLDGGIDVPALKARVENAVAALPAKVKSDDIKPILAMLAKIGDDLYTNDVITDIKEAHPKQSVKDMRGYVAERMAAVHAGDVRSGQRESVVVAVEPGTIPADDAKYTPPFEIGRKGPLNNGTNVCLVLAAFGYSVKFDAFAGKKLLYAADGSAVPNYEPAIMDIWREAIDRWGFKPSKEFFFDMVEVEAFRHTFNSAGDYFADVQAKWDGTPRIARLLSDYFGAEDTALNREIGRIVMTAIVRRVRSPGCKFDEMMVLQSPQGQNKSTAFSILAVKPEWFSDSLPLNVPGKEVMELTQGKLLVEVAELTGMTKGDRDHVKSMLSRQTDRGRPAYGREVREVPRQFVVVGTVNDSKFLNDPTGNRRFWPVTVGVIDVAALRRDVHQLYGEAATREAAGDSIRLDPAHWAAASEEQAGREKSNPYYDVLAEFVPTDRDACISLQSIMKRLEIRVQNRSPMMMELITKAMSDLGYVHVKRRFGCGRNATAGYQRGSGDTEIDVGVVCSGPPPLVVKVGA